MNASAEFLMRLVVEKHSQVTEELKKLMVVLVSENLDQKYTQAQLVLQKSNDLVSILAKEDCPAWLTTLVNSMDSFVKKKMNQSQLMDWIVKSRLLIMDHKWSFESSSETAFDFDSIFEHYKKESRLPELFDEIVKILEEIKASDKVDSMAMNNALSKVIATIKSNKNSSYFSINATWSFLVNFLNNYMWAELSNIPVLGSALEALRETMNQIDTEMFELHCKVDEDMKEKVAGEVKALDNIKPFSSIGYDRSGDIIKALPKPVIITETA